MTANRRWILGARPNEARANTLQFQPERAPEPTGDQVLVRNIYLSIDPTHRLWMSDVDQYMAPVEVGEVMRGLTIGVVEASRNPDLEIGALVAGHGGWQDRFVAHPSALTRIAPKADLPLAAYLGPLGGIGATAYFGVFDVGQIRPGDTFVVSAAAGAVGSLAGQMAKLMGCRVIGIVGSREKAEWITSELGFDAAIIHREPDLAGQLRAACPNGIDVYFDNVGGEVLDAALELANHRARFVICGLISTYENIKGAQGPRMFRNVLMKSITVRGYIVSDFQQRWTEAYDVLSHWLAKGLLIYRLDIRDGLENAPDALSDLFTGGNTGKLIVRVSSEP